MKESSRTKAAVGKPSASYSYRLTSVAVEFLLSHGFSMEAPFVKGVAYLSREEEVAALEYEKARSNKASIADIILRADEVEALKFVRKVRDQIRKWKDRTSVGGGL